LRFAIAAQSARLLDVSPDEQLELLRRFAPTLHFDALERWRPQPVDDYLGHSTLFDGKDRALPGTPPAEAAMREHSGETKARLNPLEDGPGISAKERRERALKRSADLLAAYGSDQNLRGAGVAYGRVFRDGDKVLFLQYWLFYPDNPCVLPPGRHDGDWELVQVGLERGNGDYRPTQLTLAEHGKPVSKRIVSAGELNVFVAVDSHACYFKAGANPIIPLSDVCEPAGAPGTKPRVELLPLEPAKHDWAHWSGRWGVDRGPGTWLALQLGWKRTPWPLRPLNKVGAGESPPSPAHQGASWRSPSAFAALGTGRQNTTGALQRLAHFVGNLTWPESDPEVSVTPVAGEQGGPATTYAIEVGTAGRFLRRVSFASVAFWEERPGGDRRALAMYSVRAGTTATVGIHHEGRLEWRAAAYNRLRQRGEPILAPGQ
jgi:hypothetical protein